MTKFVLLLIFIPAMCFAEPKKHTDFFQHDYAGRVMDPKSQKNATQATTGTPETNRTLPLDATQKPVEFSGPTPSASPTPTPDENVLKDTMEAIPVKSIGAILNAKPSEKLFNDMQQAVDISLKYKYPVGDITVIGPLPRSATDAEVMGVSVRGGQLKALRILPKKYEKVTKSPTWILETAQGEILLEGFKNPQKFLNSKGEFVPNMMERLTDSDKPDVAAMPEAQKLNMP